MQNTTHTAEAALTRRLDRRSFFRLTGTAAAVGLLMSACTKDKPIDNVPENKGAPDVGSGDIGILNIIYALQQLELKLYSKVDFSSGVVSFTREQKILLSQIKVHENSHMQVLKQYLGINGLPELSVDLSAIDFNNRTQFLTTALQLENYAVAAINGLAYKLSNPDLINFVAKMVAVDARHSTYINNLINDGEFANAAFVDLATGMEKPKGVSEIFTFINSFLTEKITAKSF